jgi:hypothetical protein
VDSGALQALVCDDDENSGVRNAMDILTAPIHLAEQLLYESWAYETPRKKADAATAARAVIDIESRMHQITMAYSRSHIAREFAVAKQELAAARRRVSPPPCLVAAYLTPEALCAQLNDQNRSLALVPDAAGLIGELATQPSRATVWRNAGDGHGFTLRSRGRGDTPVSHPFLAAVARISRSDLDFALTNRDDDSFLNRWLFAESSTSASGSPGDTVYGRPGAETTWREGVVHAYLSTFRLPAEGIRVPQLVLSEEAEELFSELMKTGNADSAVARTAIRVAAVRVMDVVIRKHSKAMGVSIASVNEGQVPPEMSLLDTSAPFVIRRTDIEAGWGVAVTLRWAPLPSEPEPSEKRGELLPLVQEKPEPLDTGVPEGMGADILSRVMTFLVKREESGRTEITPRDVYRGVRGVTGQSIDSVLATLSRKRWLSVDTCGSERARDHRVRIRPDSRHWLDELGY